MELNINVNVEDGRKVVITDNSKYLDESDFYVVNTTSPLKKSDSKSITLLYLNKYSGLSEYQLNSFSKEISINFDGWFNLYYIVLPTKEWIYNNMIIVKLYDIVYYIDNNLVYLYKSGNDVIVSDYSNLIDLSESPNIKTNISIINKDYVSICFLQECYINLCKEIFNGHGVSSCLNKNNVDCELNYKRDLVWMGLNTIKYMVENNLLYEAERIIELLRSCNGVCGDKNTGGNSNGCGCS